MTAPDMLPVDSSNISAIGYDKAEEDLWVQFSSGRTYIYDHVPESTFEEMLRSSSKGSYLNREIKPTYSFRDA
jgi:hypothetical protein